MQHIIGLQPFPCMKKDLGADAAAAAAAAAASGEFPLDRPRTHGVGALVLSMDMRVRCHIPWPGRGG